MEFSFEELVRALEGTVVINNENKNFKDEMSFINDKIEQQQIADYLDKKCAEIDELVAVKQQKIETLKEYKKSLIYEYVTGKKEVI